MRILHLATSLSGGAGIAARRICEAQRMNGMDSVILAGQSSDNYELKIYEKIYSGSRLKEFQSSIITGAQTLALQNSDRLMTPLSINKLRIGDRLLSEFDLVHFHANYNFIDLKHIYEISKKIPSVITLHDQRYFTGGCHYSFECIGFNSECKSCPQVRKPFSALPKKVLKSNVEIFEKMRGIQFIAPSIWMSKIASSSQALNGKKIWTAMNPVPEVFKPSAKSNLLKDVIRIGFVSQNLNNPYKGLDLLEKALLSLEGKIGIELRLFGKGNYSMESTSFRVLHSEFNNDQTAAASYNSCDLIVVPSRQDNFPSVVSEALSCGVPVIGSHIGGIGELLSHFELPTFESGDWETLALLIENFRPDANKVAISDKAKGLFSFSESARRHRDIYENII
jgi:glycosyltransferase involved in cell wall biosynthesis